MKNTIGNSVSVTLFGESHSEGIGVVIDGLAPGIRVDCQFIAEQLELRRPKSQISTPRVEKDNFRILSGVYEGKTTGTPICIVIPNEDIKSEDYGEIRFKMRPSHADFTANEKYHGFEDFRGGGHFSGRITAALVAAGAIAIDALKNKGILIESRIVRLGGVDNPENIEEIILDAKTKGDSVGGVIETVVTGLPTGVGEPWFDSMESMLSHAVFSIPAVKGIEFGAGFSVADMLGSEANDPFRVVDGKIVTETNNNGGINGGITNGMPVVFSTAIKPTPTIFKEQNTVDIRDNSNTTLMASGRHDPCIVPRVGVVLDSVTALVLCDLLSARFGTDWMAN
ncbi:MAG: chorismate synthase [Clostridia bacterium]|nr:chorismate synthase [Clostridia bacterium]